MTQYWGSLTLRHADPERGGDERAIAHAVDSNAARFHGHVVLYPFVLCDSVH